MLAGDDRDQRYNDAFIFVTIVSERGGVPVRRAATAMENDRLRASRINRLSVRDTSQHQYLPRPPALVCSRQIRHTVRSLSQNDEHERTDKIHARAQSVTQVHNADLKERFDKENRNKCRNHERPDRLIIFFESEFLGMRER